MLIGFPRTYTRRQILAVSVAGLWLKALTTRTELQMSPGQE